MSAYISTNSPTSSYLITTYDGCKFEKYNLKSALDFCRLLGFRPVITFDLTA